MGYNIIPGYNFFPASCQRAIRIVDQLLRDVNIEGVVPLTRDSLREVVSHLLDYGDGKLQTIINDQKKLEEQFVESRRQEHPSTTDHTVNPNIAAPAAAFSGEYTGTYHLWPGIDCKFHKVYAGFKWPSDCAFSMW
jgi:hypothetical protein